MTAVIWRGTRVSADMVPPLDALAQLAGDDIYVKPIAGYGSYSTNANSAGIDTGGGHVDLDLAGLTDAQKKRLEKLARMVGFYADIREPRWWSPVREKFIYAKWQSHLHMVKKDTPDRSTAARAQVGSWYAGTNGLAGFTIDGVVRHDPDDGPREYLYQTWNQYKAKEDEMQLDDEISLITTGAVKYSSETSTVEGILKSTNYYVLQSRDAILAQLAALSGAVRALSTAQGVDPGMVETVIRESVNEALSDLRLVRVDASSPTT